MGMPKGDYIETAPRLIIICSFFEFEFEMNSFAFIVVVLLAGASLVLADDKEHHGHDWHGAGFQTCLNKSLDEAAVVKANQTCITELKLDANATMHEKLRNNTCFKVCQLQKLGFLTTDNKIDTTKMEKYVDTVYPETLRKDMKNAITSCSNNVKVNPTEPECKHMFALEQCIRMVIVRKCQGINASDKDKTTAKPA